MSEALRSLSEEGLGRALADLQIEWPAAPDLTLAVMASTRSVPGRVVRPPLSRPTRALLIAAASVLLLAGAAVAAKVLIDLGAVVVEVTPRPTALPSPTTIPFGETITRAEAADLLGEELALPSALGPPDRIWADEVLTDAGEVVRITAGWRPGPGLPTIAGTNFGAVLMRFEGDADQAFKEVFEDTGSFEPAVVDGREASWTSGPHVLELLTGRGSVFLRVEGNVLLWRDGPYTLRLETSLPKPDAVRIAGSIGGTS